MDFILNEQRGDVAELSWDKKVISFEDMYSVEGGSAVLPVEKIDELIQWLKEVKESL